MTLPIIDPSDLAPFATMDPVKAQAMIDDATALAVRVAPCIATPVGQTGALTETDQAAVKAILRNAILRWNDAGTGSVAGLQQTAGAFQVSQTLDTRSPRRGLLWPSEIADLQAICSDGSASGAYEINTRPGSVWPHVRTCPAITGGPCRCGGVLIGIGA